MKSITVPTALAALLLASSCDGTVPDADPAGGGGGVGPITGGPEYRGSTFGTQGYWSQVVGLGSGLQNEGVTLLDLLTLGLQIDSAADVALTATLTAELATDLSPANAPTLNDPAAAITAIQSGAVLGLVAADVDGDTVLDLTGVDTLGLSCALCHSTTDGAVYAGDVTGVPGTVGAITDGIAPSSIDLGDLFALADNSRALLPYLAQPLSSAGGAILSRGGGFVDESSTEAQVDAHLADDTEIPPGTWDMLPDGVGAPVRLPSPFDLSRRGDLGVAGAYELGVDFINAHVTLGLDATTLLSPDGVLFMDAVAPGIAGELRGRLQTVLTDTGVMTPPGGFPFVTGTSTGSVAVASSPVGLRVDETTLGLINGYLLATVAAAPPVGDLERRNRGELVYDQLCVGCHGSLNGTGPLAATSLDQLTASYLPTTLLVRGFPYSDVNHDLLLTFDDRLAIFDAIHTPSQVPSALRTIRTPRLISPHVDGPRLHDGSVPDLETLIDPARGAGAIHPVYPATAGDRVDLLEYLTTR